MALKDKNSSKLKFLNWILVVAILLFVGLLLIYYFNISDLSENKKGEWGTFGDFIGGTLNPLFALFSLFAIIYTIKIQTEELELSREELEATREELKGSRIAQQEQSESLKLQNEATKLQMFENTFFQLLNLFIENKKEIVYGTDAYSNKAIKKYMNSFKSTYEFNYENFYTTNESFFGTYFGQIYQVLNFINTSDIKDKQRYVNIFRAQFTKDELELLFYHCLGTIGKRRFKKLVEDYEFFEHIILNESIEKQLLEYDKKAFGKNEKILEAYKEEKL